MKIFSHIQHPALKPMQFDTILSILGCKIMRYLHA